MSKLYQYRINAGLTQYQAADEIGISQASYSRIEGGKVRPSLEMALRLENWSKGAVQMKSWLPEAAE